MRTRCLKCSMSDRYVKDILEQLEEIEKLHAKLRKLVPRVNSHGTERVSSNARRGWESVNDNQSKAKKRNSSRMSVKSTFAFPARESGTQSTSYLKNLKNRPIGDRLQRLRGNSVNYVSNRWHDMNNRVKSLLSTITERDMILVNRAAQTTDDSRPEATPRRQSVTGSVEIELSSREDQLPKKRRLLGRLLERFNYSRDPSLVDEHRVSMQQDHFLGNSEPRRVHKTLLFPDEQAQTLRVVLSAQRVSIDDNKESHSSRRSSNNRA